MILDLLLALLLSALASASTALYHHQNHGTHNYYVLHHDPAYALLADLVELLGGLQIVEPVSELKDIWLARIPRNISDSRTEHGAEEVDDPVVETYRRMRRQTLLSRRGEDMSLSLRHLSRVVASQESVARAPLSSETTPSSSAKRAPVDIKDPLFKDQWSLQLLNVPAVWEKGYTGKGIITAIMRGGFRADHKDLNYAADHSYDFITNSKTYQPTDTEVLSHDTACAGIIGAARNNLCGVGIAYDSKVAMLRYKNKKATNDVAHMIREPAAFNYHYQDISIYSCSFGPKDDGKTIGGPKYISKQALLNGVNKGRGGKGSIFVLAAGNGGNEHDDCNFDGYANSIYTITIGAVEKSGLHAKYSEPCAAVMVTVYSSANDESSSIVSLGSSSDVACSNFVYTSAAAPAAAAIFALALEARPDLTWRDMQHLCVETAQFPKGETSRDELVKGRKYNPKVGFGVLDALLFVEKAKTWSLVKPQVWLYHDDRQKVTGGERLVDGASGDTVDGAVTVTQKMVQDADFDKIEHTQVRVWIEHQKRGDIQVSLFSPRNIVCVLGMHREHDNTQEGLMGWTFMTVKYWGEDPVGEWTVMINDKSSTRERGKVLGFGMTFWGSAKNGANAKPYKMPPDDHDVFPPPNAEYVIST